MPRKLRTPKRRRDPEALDIGIASLLLHGWGSPLRKRGENPLNVYLLTDDDLQRLWREHQPALEAEARLLGITPWAISQFDEKENL